MSSGVRWAVGLGCAAVLAGLVWVVILGGRLIGGLTGSLQSTHDDPANVQLRADATRLMYGVNQNVDVDGALALFRRAHDNGDKLASAFLQLLMNNAEPGEIDEQLYSEVTRFSPVVLYRLAAEGNVEAEFLYAALWTPYEEYSEHDLVFGYAKDAAEHDYYPAYSLLGSLYEFGNGTPVDYGDAEVWFSKARDAGSVSGLAGLGRIYTYIGWTDYEPEQGVVLLKQAAERNGRFAMLRLGEFYEQGTGNGPDLELARKYYRDAADAGLPKAMVTLARMYRDGDGVEQDLGEARRLLERACKWELPEAHEMLAQLPDSPAD